MSERCEFCDRQKRQICPMDIAGIVVAAMAAGAGILALFLHVSISVH